ncbi:MAG: bifunctional [glutamine synthetase] adenylyltransferase/[glutamine synthetase]-adenylyl-L-tyrosine phosphorylase, partial [Actinobacteria bacterium]|nr:bifunctional [glutamine synthetase] adenylyltransferase/[glutamine synthetase]-adenylyl-L-tyrosine phosphorylase [Actinomycetota bacterium]
MSEALVLTDVAKAGFIDLRRGREVIEQLCVETGLRGDELLELFAHAAEPDVAGQTVIDILAAPSRGSEKWSADRSWLERVIRVAGASRGLAEFFVRHPARVDAMRVHLDNVRDEATLVGRLLASVGADSRGFATGDLDTVRDSLRSEYRAILCEISCFDLSAEHPTQVVDSVARGLADAAAGALEASLAVARAELAAQGVPAHEIELVRLAIIGMGKCGARELNYVSDVDVIYVAESADPEIVTSETALTHATRLAQLLARGIQESGREPGLWEVDANLRPEGKAGALVRTLESHLAYYDRWAKNWEFQALLKARPIAGDRELGQQYVDEISPKVWSSAAREGFVDQVQRMRERVTDNIPPAEVDIQIKLGPGGLRDVEFTVQLLQLVHGLQDETVRLRGTIESLQALVAGGYVGRDEATTFAESYRLLRVLEHRLQLRALRRTHLMPTDAEDIRVLSRAAGFDVGEVDVVELWRATKVKVRALHERLFYRPLLAAAAALPEEGLNLTTEQAQARLAAIGFEDPKGAMAQITALTSGMTRRSTIQRAILPILLQWLADGADPDYGLLAFRRLSEALGDSPWYLKMLRDSQAAAERLMKVLSGSRYVSDLLERLPEATAWLDDDQDLSARSAAVLRSEVEALLSRHDDSESALTSVRALRRREMLRMALAGIVGVGDFAEIAGGLTTLSTVVLEGFLAIVRRESETNPEFAIVAMGRFGGGELVFGSDLDLIFVHRGTTECHDQAAQARAEAMVSRLLACAEDPRLTLEIDLDLRPEGKQGVRVRTLDSYAQYYERWGATWESQALLRARVIAGDEALVTDMTTLIDRVRYPREVPLETVRDIRRIKSRVERERLPQGADA